MREARQVSEILEPTGLVVITGGSSGLGLGLVQACRERGKRVIFTYRTPAHRDQALELLDHDPLVEALPLEVAAREQVFEFAHRVIARWGSPDWLFANAGVGHKVAASEARWDQWGQTLEVNLHGVIHTLQAFLPAMLARGRGHLAATASMSGLFPAGRSGVYTTSKFAVVGLMESLRGELSGTGLGVSVICPGMVQGRIRDPERQGQPASLLGMPALECAQRILEGIERNPLFILTHPEFRSGLEERFELLRRAFPDPCHEQPWWALEQPVLRYPPYGEELEGRGD